MATVSCYHDSRDLHAARHGSARSPSGLASDSWGLCSIIGPHNHNPGVWGADLGLSAHTANAQRLILLFGDTWASPIDGCQFCPAPDNDMQATLPRTRPATFGPGAPADYTHAHTCDLIEYARERDDDVTSWRRARLFPNAHSLGDDALDMSGLRTPLATFSDGDRMLAIFLRRDAVPCRTGADCPDAMACTGDPSYAGEPLGECSRIVDLQPDPPAEYCRDDDDCIPGSSCKLAVSGVCVATRPFEAHTADGPRTPRWYRDNPKQGLAGDLYVAAAIWPDRPADYATIARFATQRFQNVTTRSIAYFDPQHPERNDYTPGYHTLLVWGRPAFVESGGAQALPFLLYVPLAELRGAPEQARWHPRFFAGYDAAGDPMWSESESDAQPLYGVDAHASRTRAGALEFNEPEFDIVAQMSVSWVAPLSRWVMFYGGDLPAFMVADAKSGATHDPVHLQWSPGAIHMRVAAHPWGAAHAYPDGNGGGATPDGAWSSPEPVLTRERAAPYLACGSGGRADLPGCEEDHEPFRPFALVSAVTRQALHSRSLRQWADVTGTCVLGELERAFQRSLSGDPIGRLYAPNIIEEWTTDVTPPGAREHSAELYWNVSTWNPYQVALFKTRLHVRTAASDETSKASLMLPTARGTRSHANPIVTPERARTASGDVARWAHSGPTPGQR
jgi:hypothetical protein